jgi:hypothetical protein
MSESGRPAMRAALDGKDQVFLQHRRHAEAHFPFASIENRPLP